MTSSLTPFRATKEEREQLIDLLGYAAAAPPEVLKALVLLENPDCLGMTFNTVLKRAGCSPAAFNAALRDATIAKGHAEALTRMMAKLPDVVDDMATAATTHTYPCECTQTSSGPIPALATCPDCKGRGVRTHRPDVDRHRLFAEAAGLIKKGPQVSVTNTQQIAAGFSAGAFDRLIKSTDNAMDSLRPAADAVDAEIVPEEPPHGR